MYKIPKWAKDESVSALEEQIRKSMISCTHPIDEDRLLHTSINFVILSNKHEGTISNSIDEKELYNFLQNSKITPKDPVENLKPLCGFFTSGSESQKETQSQLVQHLRALFFMLQNVDKDLNEDIICTAHMILFEGATIKRVYEFWRSYDVKMDGGIYRTCFVSSGTGFEYTKPSSIKSDMEYILREYNLVRDRRQISDCAKLFYCLIRVHPFEDGNGRLCRIILAYSLIQMGFAIFPVTLSSSHPKKSMSHYINAIRRIDTRKDYSHLEYLILYSLRNSWIDFNTYKMN